MLLLETRPFCVIFLFFWGFWASSSVNLRNEWVFNCMTWDIIILWNLWEARIPFFDLKNRKKKIRSRESRRQYQPSPLKKKAHPNSSKSSPCKNFFAYDSQGSPWGIRLFRKDSKQSWSAPSMGALGDDKTLILPEMPWRTHQRHSATALPGAGAAKYGYLGLVAKNTKGPTKSGSIEAREWRELSEGCWDSFWIRQWQIHHFLGSQMVETSKQTRVKSFRAFHDTSALGLNEWKVMNGIPFSNPWLESRNRWYRWNVAGRIANHWKRGWGK